MPPFPSDSPRAAQRLAWLSGVLGHARFTLERASNDAGCRSYWRVTGEGGSRVLMDAPPALEPVAPWLRVRVLLAAGGVCVPRVLAEDVEQGFVLLEDLGPSTCLHLLTSATADALFAAAIEQLLRVQAIAPPPEMACYDRAFLLRELGLFEEWFLRRHLGIDLAAADAQTLAAGWEFLVESALAQPQVLVHRDFMPRNLIPQGETVAVIDFQDAVRGPIAYDVASLFKDAFISWPEADVQRWFADYHHRARAAGLPVPQWAQFVRDVELIGVQRHLKILGVFARLHYRDGKLRYLQDAARFVAYLDAVLPRWPQLAALAELIARRVRPALAAPAEGA